MKVVQLPIKLPELPNNTPEYESRPYPNECFKLHILGACIGGRSQGKTTFALRLIKLYDRCKSFDRIIIFSTTAHKEPKMMNFMKSKTFAEITHHRGFSVAELKEEMERMESDIEAFRAYKKKLEIWNKFVYHHHSVDAMTQEELMWLDEMEFEKPICPNKSGMYPCHLVLFDDLLGVRVFNANMSGLANNLLISHRHYSASVFILSQSFVSFIPKPVRSQNIGLWILFGSKCAKSMKDIAEDVASKVSPDQFIAAWKLATQKPFMPFLCDYDTADNSRRFRQGIDKLIIMDAEECEEKNEITKKE
jgi:hypothetical protein